MAEKKTPGRNEPCACGSGRKYKHCCLPKEGQVSGRQRLMLVVAAIALVGGLIFAITNRVEPTGQAGRVWSPEHGHYH